jgi:hypothetical protein
MVDFLHGGEEFVAVLLILPQVRRVPSTILYQRFYLSSGGIWFPTGMAIPIPHEAGSIYGSLLRASAAPFEFVTDERQRTES